jgi:hypothetical protein
MPGESFMIADGVRREWCVLLNDTLKVTVEELLLTTLSSRSAQCTASAERPTVDSGLFLKNP